MKKNKDEKCGSQIRIQLYAKVGQKTYEINPWEKCDADHCSLFKDGVCNQDEECGKCPDYPCIGEDWNELHLLINNIFDGGYMVKEVKNV